MLGYDGTVALFDRLVREGSELEKIKELAEELPGWFARDCALRMLNWVITESDRKMLPFLLRLLQARGALTCLNGQECGCQWEWDGNGYELFRYHLNDYCIN